MSSEKENDKRTNEETHNSLLDHEVSKRLRKSSNNQEDYAAGGSKSKDDSASVSADESEEHSLSASVEQQCTLSHNNTVVESVGIAEPEPTSSVLLPDETAPAVAHGAAKDTRQSAAPTTAGPAGACDKTIEELVQELEDELGELPIGPQLEDAMEPEPDNHVASPVDEERENRLSARARRHRRDSSDSDENSTDEDEEHSETGNTLSGTEEEMAATTSAGHQQQQAEITRSWHSYGIVRKREYGNNNRFNPAWFRYGAMGSMYMVERLELMYKLEKHDGCVNCLHFNQSGTRLASGADDTFVNLWDWATGESLLHFDSGHRANVFQSKFMPLSGDCHLVTCARDGQVRLAELSVRGICKSTRKLAQHKGAAHKLSVENESPHVFLSCGEDAVVFQIDLRDPKPDKILTCKNASERKVALYSIQHHPMDSVNFAVSGRDQFCRVYDRRQTSECLAKHCPQHLVNVDAFKANITCCVYNHNGTELLATYNDEDIYTFDTANTQAHFLKRFRGHRNNATVKGVNYYGAGCEFIVSGSDDGYVYFWHKDTEKIVNFLPADEGGVVNCLEPHPTCPVIATSGLDHDVKIWIPSCETPKFNEDALNKLTKRNLRERRRGSRNYDESDSVDSQMLWFFISRMQRARRRGERNEEPSASDSSASDEDASGDEPSPRASIQCRTS